MRIWLYGHILWLILRRALIIHSYFFIYLSRPKCRVCQEYVCPWDTYEFCQLLVGGTVISFLKWCNFHMYFSDIEMCIASQRCMLLRTSKVCYFRTSKLSQTQDLSALVKALFLQSHASSFVLCAFPLPQ